MSVSILSASHEGQAEHVEASRAECPGCVAQDRTTAIVQELANAAIAWSKLDRDYKVACLVDGGSDEPLDDLCRDVDAADARLAAACHALADDERKNQ